MFSRSSFATLKIEKIIPVVKGLKESARIAVQVRAHVILPPDEGVVRGAGSVSHSTEPRGTARRGAARQSGR